MMGAETAGPAASVVIPTRDKQSRLRLTLACLEAQSGPGDWEVVVVDDGSQDGTLDVLRHAARRLPLRVLDSGGAGRSAARNLGARAATRPLLVFLDDDVVVPAGWLTGHRRAQREESVFVHGPLRELPAALRLDRPRPGTHAALGLEPERLTRHGFTEARTPSRVNALEQAVLALHAATASADLGWLTSVGANLSMPKLVWEQVGGFDPRFGQRWGLEDLELGLRLVAHGVRPRLAFGAQAVHLTHGRGNRWQEQERNLGLLRALHPRPDVDALPLLLGPDGDPHRYFEEIGRQTRSANGEPASRPRSCAQEVTASTNARVSSKSADTCDS